MFLGTSAVLSMRKMRNLSRKSQAYSLSWRFTSIWIVCIQFVVDAFSCVRWFWRTNIGAINLNLIRECTVKILHMCRTKSAKKNPNEKTNANFFLRRKHHFKWLWDCVCGIIGLSFIFLSAKYCIFYGVCVSLSRCQEWRANNRLFIFSCQRKNWYKKKTNLWKMFYLLWIFACVHFRWAANRKPMNNVLNSRCDVNAQIDASIYLKIRLRIRRSINASRWANT